MHVLVVKVKDAVAQVCNVGEMRLEVGQIFKEYHIYLFFTLFVLGKRAGVLVWMGGVFDWSKHLIINFILGIMQQLNYFLRPFILFRNIAPVLLM